VYALSNKGIALLELGENDKAIEEYDKAIKIDPNNVVIYSNKGIALKNLGKYEEAIQEYDKALAIDPNYARAWYNKSCDLAPMGNIDDSLKNLEQAIRLDKSYIESARTDKDFDSIRNDKRFKKLILLYGARICFLKNMLNMFRC